MCHDVRLQHLKASIDTGALDSLSRVVAGFDNLLEGGLKGSTTDKESVDIGEGNKLISILISHAATVEDASLVGCLSRDICSEPGSYVSVSLLGLLWGSNHTGSNGPDGLVGNDNFAPVIDLFADSLKLSSIDFVGLASFTLIELLSNASHDGDVLVKSGLDLLADSLVALAEDVASLAMSEDAPVESEVLKHDSAGLTSVSSVAVKGAVLCGKLDGGTGEGSLGSTEMKGRGSDNDLNLGLVDLHVLEYGGGELTSEVDGPVAFPVASNKQFAH